MTEKSAEGRELTEESDHPVGPRHAGRDTVAQNDTAENPETDVDVSQDVSKDASQDVSDGADGEKVDDDGVEQPSRAALALDQLTHVRRPVEMTVAAVFLTIAALPMVLAGFALALQVAGIGENLRQQISASGTSLGVDSVILLFRFAGVALLIIGVLFVAFTWAAVRPKRWGRAAATVLAVVEILLLVVGMVLTTVDPVSLGIVLLTGAGVVLFYLPRSEEFLLTSR